MSVESACSADEPNFGGTNPEQMLFIYSRSLRFAVCVILNNIDITCCRGEISGFFSTRTKTYKIHHIAGRGGMGEDVLAGVGGGR
jgi:hypothetical protein